MKGQREGRDCQHLDHHRRQRAPHEDPHEQDHDHDHDHDAQLERHVGLVQQQHHDEFQEHQGQENAGRKRHKIDQGQLDLNKKYLNFV